MNAGGLVWCAALFCTYREAAASAALARATWAKMSEALAVQMKGLRSMLWCATYRSMASSSSATLITALAKNLQRQGLRPNRSARYRAYVQQLRGWLQSEIGRVMNRLVETHAPAAIASELLDFRAPGLSRRLNRLIGTFGQRVLEAKFVDLEQRFGIELVKVNPAYSSQECNACGYVDKRNRPRQSVFRCLWCGSKRDGDVNAACNLRTRRSAPREAARRHRQSILADLVQGFTRPEKASCCSYRMPTSLASCHAVGP